MSIRTFAALTTPPGEGGIAVIEVHGPAALAVLLRHFRVRRPLEPRRLTHGLFRDAGGRPLDEILAQHVPAADSLTGLECVEIHCHGGPAPVRSILDALDADDVREIDWRELVAEAFHNGRIDAIQREAIILLSSAPTPLGARMLNDQRNGTLSRKVEAMRGGDDVERLLATARTGMALVRPTIAAIVGPVNGGKSALFNALCGGERALVHDAPGTTRDPVEAMIAIDGVPITLVDSAGLGPPVDEMHRIAQARTMEAVRRADIIIAVIDHPGDSIENLAGEKPVIAVLSKTDLRRGESPGGLLAVSALEKTGLDALRIAIRTASGVDPSIVVPNAPVVFTERQERILREALERGAAVTAVKRAILREDHGC